MKAKVVFLAVLVSLVLSTGLYAGARRQSGGLTIKPGVLMIGMEIGYPPMEYLAADGRTPIGFDVELGKAIAAKMGLQAEFIDTAWDGIFAGVETNKFDAIISAVTINDARLRAHNFSKPYIQNTLAIVRMKGAPDTVRSPQDLAGLNVAFQGETTADDFMSDLAAAGLRFTPREYDQIIHCFPELQLGRVDAVVTDLLVAYEFVGRANSPFEIVWQGGEEEFGICMRRGNDALTVAIDEALDALFADGTMQRLSYETFGMDLVSAVRR